MSIVARALEQDSGDGDWENEVSHDRLATPFNARKTF
jgi:hypothetical protein